jgi:hypothetical protein
MAALNFLVIAVLLCASTSPSDRKNNVFVESYEVKYTDFRSFPKPSLNPETISKGWQYSFTDRSNNGVNGWSWSLLWTSIQANGELPLTSSSKSLAIKGVVIFHMSDGTNHRLCYTANCEMLYDGKLYRWNQDLIKAVFHAIESHSPSCQ